MRKAASGTGRFTLTEERHHHEDQSSRVQSQNLHLHRHIPSELIQVLSFILLFSTFLSIVNLSLFHSSNLIFLLFCTFIFHVRIISFIYYLLEAVDTATSTSRHFRMI